MFLLTTPKDFDKMATLAVNQFGTQGVSLNQAVADVASQNKLNPMEVKALLSQANTKAVLELLSTAEDKRSEIALADYSQVMRSLYPEGTEASSAEGDTAGTKEDTSTEKTAHFPNLRKEAQVQGVKFPTLEKTAVSREPTLHTQIFRGKRAIEKLQTDKMATEVGIQKTAAQLVTHFDHIYAPSFEKFADECFSTQWGQRTSSTEGLGRMLGRGMCHE